MRMKQGTVAGLVTLLVMIVVCSCGKASDQAAIETRVAETLTAIARTREATPTDTPANTPTSTATSTATPTPTNTPTITATSTPKPTTPPTPPCCQRATGALCSDDAWNHMGQNRAVEFCVARTYNSGKAVFLDSCADYKGHFYVPIFPEYWGCWSEPPETYFYGHCVVVQGEITIYQGSPEVILRSCDLIRDLGPCNPATDSCK